MLTSEQTRFLWGQHVENEKSSVEMLPDARTPLVMLILSLIIWLLMSEGWRCMQMGIRSWHSMAKWQKESEQVYTRIDGLGTSRDSNTLHELSSKISENERCCLAELKKLRVLALHNKYIDIFVNNTFRKILSKLESLQLWYYRYLKDENETSLQVTLHHLISGIFPPEKCIDLHLVSFWCRSCGGRCRCYLLHPSCTPSGPFL